MAMQPKATNFKQRTIMPYQQLFLAPMPIMIKKTDKWYYYKALLNIKFFSSQYMVFLFFPNISNISQQRGRIQNQPFHKRAVFAFSFVIRPGFSSRTSIAVIAALARYGGKEAEKTYPELLNRCQKLAHRQTLALKTLNKKSIIIK